MRRNFKVRGSGTTLHTSDLLRPKELQNKPVSGSSSARAPLKSPQVKHLEVVNYRREEVNKKRKKQPRLNNMKQIFVSSPTHAKVDLCSENASKERIISNSKEIFK